jgi:hypothetical protein
MCFAKLLKPVLRLAVIALVVLPAVISYGQDRRNFWALNNTGKTIREFYVSPHESGNWGRDTLGETQLGNGTGTLISFTGRSSCVMDFKLVFTDGTDQTYEQGVCLLGAVHFNRYDSIGLSLPSA